MGIMLALLAQGLGKVAGFNSFSSKTWLPLTEAVGEEGSEKESTR